MKFYLKITSKETIKPSFFYLITSHHPPCQLNRTFHLKVAGHNIYLCSRCLAQYLGIGFLFGAILLFGVHNINFFQAVFFFGVLPFPATFDWVTQTIRKRESNNFIRFVTGFLFGLSIGAAIVVTVFQFNNLMFYVMFFIYTCYIGVVLYLLKASGVVNDYLAPYEKFVATDK